MKKIFVMIFLLLLLSIAYYFFAIFLPAKKRQINIINQQASEDASQANCANMASAYMTSKGLTDGNGTVFTQKSHFNDSLGKCFILVSSYQQLSDSLSINLYDAGGGGHYAEYDGHSDCDPEELSVTTEPDKCDMDSGDVWVDGDDSKKPSDFHVGYDSQVAGSTGGGDTQKQFMDKIQTFMND